MQPKHLAGIDVHVHLGRNTWIPQVEMMRLAFSDDRDMEAQAASELGITADTTDEQLALLEQQILAAAGDLDVRGLPEYLDWLREGRKMAAEGTMH